MLDPFFEAVASDSISLITSTITLCEVLVQPLKREDEPLAFRYNELLLASPNVRTYSVTPAIAQAAAELRATAKLRTPDAIQAATAISHGATTLVTNDRDFRGVTGLQIIRLDELLERTD